LETGAKPGSLVLEKIPAHKKNRLETGAKPGSLVLEKIPAHKKTKYLLRGNLDLRIT